jgi:hypothetical protein
VPVVGQQPPDGPAVGLHRLVGGAGRHTEPPGRDALAQQHPGHVVVGHHEQLGRVAERFVVGQDARVDVAVRADQRQVGGQRV